MDNLISERSMIMKKNLSIIDDYFKRKNNKKQLNNLKFPNSTTQSEYSSKKLTYRPCEKIKINKTDKSTEKCSKLLKNKNSTKSTEISTINYDPKDEENYRTSDNLLSDKFFLNNFREKEQNKIIDYNKDENNKLEIKYSWQDIKNWIPPSEKKKFNNQCELKYSWQVIGVESQTSQTLFNNNNSNEIIKNPCKIKYSWEVIGLGTQASLHELSSEDDYWNGKILTAKIRGKINDENSSNCFNKNRILCNAGTQSTADKGVHADFTDCTVKYSWQNLTKAYLRSNECT